MRDNILTHSKCTKNPCRWWQRELRSLLLPWHWGKVIDPYLVWKGIVFGNNVSPSSRYTWLSKMWQRYRRQCFPWHLLRIVHSHMQILLKETGRANTGQELCRMPSGTARHGCSLHAVSDGHLCGHWSRTGINSSSCKKKTDLQCMNYIPSDVLPK